MSYVRLELQSLDSNIAEIHFATPLMKGWSSQDHYQYEHEQPNRHLQDRLTDVGRKVYDAIDFGDFSFAFGEFSLRVQVPRALDFRSSLWDLFLHLTGLLYTLDEGYFLTVASRDEALDALEDIHRPTYWEYDRMFEVCVTRMRARSQPNSDVLMEIRDLLRQNLAELRSSRPNQAMASTDI